MTGSTPASVLEKAGWARSVAGSGPYLTFFSRAGLSREAVDNAAAKLEIHELPSARNCTYILPASDFALGLRVGQEFSTGESVLARKLGVTDSEVEKLCSAVLDVLRKGPLLPDEIREASGSASRSLGPEGAKKGLSTTLPLALGSLQVTGQIRRIPVNGRLDQQRYRYALWKANPMTKVPPLGRGIVHRACAPLFSLDRPSNAVGIPMVFRVGYESRQSSRRTAGP